MKKKVLSMLVTFAMLLSMFPATAFAADFNVTADGNDLDGADSADFYTFDGKVSVDNADAGESAGTLNMVVHWRRCKHHRDWLYLRLRRSASYSFRRLRDR